MYSGTSLRRVLSLFIVTLFFFGCGNDSPMGPNGLGKGSWSSLSNEERNKEILDEAKARINEVGGQCKAWIQNVVNIASGQLNHLPQNHIKAGDMYNKAKWQDSPNVEVVWQRAYQSPAGFPRSIKPGNIIQFRYQGNHNNSDDATGLHTALIESVDSLSMTWIDSNWKGKELVRQHVFSLSDWSKTIEAWTVYQVK